jgi:hypothetical protein
MATPAPLPPSPTRQLLDELDALMQRMLSLPVNQLEEDTHTDPADASAAPAVDEPAADSMPAQAPEPTPVSFQPITPVETSPESSALDNSTVVPSPPEPSAPAALLIPIAAATSVEPPSRTGLGLRLTPPSPALPAPILRSREPVRWWLVPAIKLNLAFDRCTMCLGRPGSWLRGERGRALLGWTGLTLVGAAVVRAILGWMGWTW